MIKHVVVAKFKAGVSDAVIADIEKGLSGLPAIIAEIKQFQFGRDVLRSERSYDFALASEFEDLEALKRYLVHPAHVEAATILRQNSESLIVADFEV